MLFAEKAFYWLAALVAPHQGKIAACLLLCCFLMALDLALGKFMKVGTEE